MDDMHTALLRQVRLLLPACLHTHIQLRHASLKLSLFMPSKRTLAREQEVNSLERASCRLGEEAVNHRDVRKHGRAEHIKRLLPNAVKHDGHEKRAAAEANGPAGDAKGVALGAQPGREDLGRVDEGDHEPGGAEDEHVDKDHGGGGGAVLLAAVRVVDGGAVERADAEEDEAERHGAPVERASPADGVEREGGDGRAEDADHHQQRRQPVGLAVVEARGAEDGARVDDHGGNARAVLHEHLQPEGELHAAADVDVAGPHAEEHLEVARALRLPLHVHHGDDLLVLALHVRVVGVVVAADLGDDLEGLLVAAALDQPPRRLGHQQGPDEQEHERDDLRGEAEAPAEGAAAGLREGGAEADPRRHGDAREVCQEGQRNHLAAVRGGRQLGGPGRGDDDDEGHAAAGAQAGDKHVREVHGAGLQHDAEQAPDEGHPDALDASVLVREVAGPEGAEQRAGVVRRHDAALQ